MVFGIDDAIGLGMGLVSTVSGLFGSGAQDQQRADSIAYQKSNEEFGRWSASISSQQADLGNKYKYWQETVSYNQGLAYTNQLRNFELTRAINQAQVVADTRASSGAAYSSDSQALNQSIQEQATQDAVSMYQYQMQAARAGAAYAAGAGEGNSVDRLVNDYSRQVGDFKTLQAINAGFRNRQFTRQQAGQVAQYLSQYNSQQFYQQQPYQDPLPPAAPLPTLVMPSGPSMTGGSSGSTSGINAANAVLGGINTGISAWQGLQKYTGGGKPSGAFGTGFSSNVNLAFSSPSLI